MELKSRFWANASSISRLFSRFVSYWFERWTSSFFCSSSTPPSFADYTDRMSGVRVWLNQGEASDLSYNRIVDNALTLSKYWLSVSDFCDSYCLLNDSFLSPFRAAGIETSRPRYRLSIRWSIFSSLLTSLRAIRSMKCSFFYSVSTSSKLLQLTESVEGLDSGPWCTIGYAIFPDRYICRPESKLRRAIVCIRYRMMNFFKSIIWIWKN